MSRDEIKRAAPGKGKPGEHWDFVSRILECVAETKYWKGDVD